MKKLLLSLSLSLFVFTAAFAQDLESANNLCKEGNNALTEGNVTVALQKFEEALSQADIIGPDADEIATQCKSIIPALLVNVGKDQANKNMIEDAVATLKKAIEKGTEYGQNESVTEATMLIPQLFINEGNSLLSTQDFAGAAVQYQKATEFDPTNGMAFLRLGMSLIRSNDEANAIAALNKAKELGQAANANKEISNYFLKKAAAFLKAKKYADAIEAAKTSNSALESAQGLNILGKSAIALKKYDDAIAAFEAYLAKSPQAKDADQTMYQLANAFEAKGDKAKACGYYKQILSNPQFQEFAKFKVNELKCN